MAAVKLGSKAVGSIVKIKVDEVLTDFIIVNQGLPSDLYDSSCNGTWVLMKDCYTQAVWNSARTNDYANSTVNSYLNNTFRLQIAANIRAQIKLVKIPYRPGSGTSMTVSSGSSGLSTRIFLLSDCEVGYTNSNINGYYIVNDGTKLSYFQDANATSEKIAKYNGGAATWFLRSPTPVNSSSVWAVSYDGTAQTPFCYNPNYIRPAFILPTTLYVSDDGTVLTNQAPTVPTSLTVPSTIQSTENFTVSWGASTDADGNLAGYELERSIDTGTWTQVYKGTALKYTDNLPYGTGTVVYRVRAYDSEGEFSGYRTSSAVAVINNLPPTAPASITVPTPVAGHTIAITWGEATDPDGTVVSYQLERSVNDSGWVQIYSGPELGYTDTVGGAWGTVAYRVRAVDDKSAAGPYITGQTYTVQNDILYISGPAPNMGAQPKPFIFTFSVDISGSTETVDNVFATASLDGYGIYTGTITSAQTVSLSVDVRAIGAGEHTIHVTADRPLSIGAQEDYRFTVADTIVPAGGYGTLLQDNTGAAVFPQTTAGLVAGLKGKSVGENLAELFAAVEAIQGAIQKGIELYREEDQA